MITMPWTFCQTPTRTHGHTHTHSGTCCYISVLKLMGQHEIVLWSNVYQKVPVLNPNRSGTNTLPMFKFGFIDVKRNGETAGLKNRAWYQLYQRREKFSYRHSLIKLTNTKICTRYKSSIFPGTTHK